MKAFCLALAFLCVATVADAQTTAISTNPGVMFTVSAKHYANYLDGTPMVTNYEFTAMAMNGLGAIALTVNIGKPTPDGTSTVTVPIPQLSTITPNTMYTATVTAIGPGGSEVSAASPPFGVSALVSPGSPANVRVK